ncbi:hypothetical protein FV228_11255 [Methylobacterium sp. WL18]|nr:hypothetical protein FV228_11255 [Methylobacterium sp. WL18]
MFNSASSPNGWNGAPSEAPRDADRLDDAFPAIRAPSPKIGARLRVKAHRTLETISQSGEILVLRDRIELSTSSLPKTHSSQKTVIDQTSRCQTPDRHRAST